MLEPSVGRLFLLLDLYRLQPLSITRLVRAAMLAPSESASRGPEPLERHVVYGKAES